MDPTIIEDIKIRIKIIERLISESVFDEFSRSQLEEAIKILTKILEE